MTDPRAEAPVRAVLVAVGEELLLGRTVDTNGAWLGDALASLGAPVLHKATVGDDEDRIRRALTQGLSEADVVVLCGGLGPTEDDRTRDAVAAGLGLTLRVDERLLRALEERYRRRGYDELPPANLRQAQVPEGALALPNPVGTAPGLVLDAEDRLVALLPGVPREMKALFPAVADEIRARFGPRLRPVEMSTLHTTGIPESVLAPRVDAAMKDAPDGVEVAFLPDLTGVDVRLTIRDRDPVEARDALRRARELLAPVVDGHAIPGDRGDLAEAVLDALRSRGWMLGLGESCTGGLVAKRLTDVAGSSAVLAGGVVAYANEAKIRFLDVPEDALRQHGAVSEPVARAMARGAARAFGVHCGLGVTGVAGPGGGTEEKPVGTVFVAATVGDRTEVERHDFPGDREAVRIRSAQAVLALLHRLAEDSP